VIVEISMNKGDEKKNFNEKDKEKIVDEGDMHG